MALLKRYSIALLLAGIGLIIGSCVPLGQTLWSAQTAPAHRLALPPGNSPATLEIDETLTASPVVVIEPYPGVADTAGEPLAYALSIREESRGVLVDERGTVSVRPTLLRLRFPEVTIPAGDWAVRFDAHDGAGLIRGAELRLIAASPGLMPALMTTLVLAILGWLAASLGALHWIRAEAARPGADGLATDRDEQARLWTVGCHLSGLLGYLLPFGHLLGPLAIWLSKRDVFPAVEQAGRRVLNFQLSVTLYVLAGLVLSFFLIGVAVLFTVAVFHFAMVLYASLRAQRGLEVSYPFTIRFI